MNYSKNVDVTKKRVIVIPFYKYFTPILNKLAKELDFIPINKITNKFNNMIRLGKDLVNDKEKSGVTYKINCIDCNMCYIDQKPFNTV